MRQKTRTELIDELNKKSQECAMFAQKNIMLENAMATIERELYWHKKMNQQLVECMSNGAKEGAWPRRVVL